MTFFITNSDDLENHAVEGPNCCALNFDVLNDEVLKKIFILSLNG